MKEAGSRYEFVADPALVLFFRNRLIPHLKSEGFSEVLELGSPEAGAWECKKGESIVTINTNPEEGAREKLHIESTAFSLDDIMVSVVKAAVAGLIEMFLKPRVKGTSQEIRAQVSACLKELGIPSI